MGRSNAPVPKDLRQRGNKNLRLRIRRAGLEDEFDAIFADQYRDNYRDNRNSGCNLTDDVLFAKAWFKIRPKVSAWEEQNEVPLIGAVQKKAKVDPFPQRQDLPEPEPDPLELKPVEEPEPEGCLATTAQEEYVDEPVGTELPECGEEQEEATVGIEAAVDPAPEEKSVKKRGRKKKTEEPKEEAPKKKRNRPLNRFDYAWVLASYAKRDEIALEDAPSDAAWNLLQMADDVGIFRDIMKQATAGEEKTDDADKHAIEKTGLAELLRQEFSKEFLEKHHADLAHIR